MNALTQFDLVAALQSLAHTRLADCYQCGNCTAGCPRSAHMDVAPNRIIRMLHLGDAESALKSEAIWQCVSCETCTTRCPKNVDCAAVMDALREVASRRHLTNPRQAPVVLFQQAFLDNIRRHGRVNEMELIAQYKLKGLTATWSPGFLFKDAALAPKLRARRKLHLRGEKVRDRELVRRIFARCLDAQ